MTVSLVIDTSYLLELYRVPAHSSEGACAEIRRRFEQHIEGKSRFFVPLGCILELGNHIAQLDDGAARHRFAQRLADDVATSVDRSTPWLIKPAVEPADLPALIAEFGSRAAGGIGLVDCGTAGLARALKEKYRSFDDYRVHIWTKDSALKHLEPDPEPQPFLG
jgi:hypothetical protein